MGSNPTPDSTLIYLPMDRKLRRELSKRKWISRAKKVYNSCGKFYIPVNGIKASVQYNVPIFRNRALRICESISKRTSFYKDGIVYQKPHIILEFSERHDESIYFDSDEEMEGWLESFRQEFGKPFMYIE